MRAKTVNNSVRSKIEETKNELIENIAAYDELTRTDVELTEANQ